MALTRVNNIGITDGGIHSADLADGIVTPSKMHTNAASTLFASNTSALAIPRGTTAQRPASPQNGQIRFNTEVGKLEVYNSTKAQWVAAGAGGGASAGLAFFASSW